MNIKLKTFNIFRRGSKTYFYSSIFFPDNVRDDVFVLYAFVRVADDLVDSVPQRTREFLDFKKKFQLAWTKEIGDEVIDNFVNMAKRVGIEKKWVEAFLEAMESDTRNASFKTMSELEKYIYGSANVIGLMMAKIMHLKDEALDLAAQLGKSMQFVNFIRDVEEDNGLGRTYFPVSELQKYGLVSLKRDEVMAKKDNFDKFCRAQIQTYFEWEKEAEKGFKFLPKRYKIPIMTANLMYKWTAMQIQRNPTIVFEKKVKPGVARILWQILKLSLFSR